MGKEALKNPNRRVFLVSASAAAAAGLVLVDAAPVVAQAGVQSGTQPGTAAAPGSFQVITAETIQNDAKALQTVPGSDNLVTLKECSVVLTAETAHSATEFEWHEGRDHILQVIDGTTVYELGGTPRDAHSSKSGEWLAPASDGAAIVTLHKGDMLINPRGMPHKRSTAASVTFTLISPSGAAKS
jgi:hypothetical protein